MHVSTFEDVKLMLALLIFDHLTLFGMILKTKNNKCFGNYKTRNNSETLKGISDNQRCLPELLNAEGRECMMT